MSPRLKSRLMDVALAFGLVVGLSMMAIGIVIMIRVAAT